MIKNLPFEFLQEYHDCVGCMRSCIVVEKNDPTGGLACSFRFDRLAKGGQGLRVTQGIHCCPMLQEVYQKGPSWSKKNVSITFPALVWMALDFFDGGDPGYFQVETLSFRFWFEVMTPRLISSHH